MKYISFCVTLALHFWAAKTLKLLDRFDTVMAIFLLVLLVGGALNFLEKGSMVGKIGWGLFYGSLTAFILVVIFLIWLSQNL